MKEVAIVFRVIVPDDSRVGLLREAITDAILVEAQALDLDMVGMRSQVEELDEESEE